MIQCLTHENPHYTCNTDFHRFSQCNLDSLFRPGSETQNEGVPCTLEIGFIHESKAITASASGYTEHGNLNDDPPDGAGSILMENVGYMMGDKSLVSYRNMKMKALLHCLAGRRFV